MKDEVPIAKDEKDEASGSLTTEGSKAQLCGPNIEEEEKMLQCMMRKLELMLKEQKDYTATLREEYIGKPRDRGKPQRMIMRRGMVVCSISQQGG